jgi:acetolactate synthase-1/2/3 large subunit
MGFALPAAIGLAMADPTRHVVAFTGDGGLMMCTAELATAAQLGCRLTVVVFNDSAITMIGLKQRSRQLAPVGMDYSPTDFAMVARGFGCAGFRAEDPAQLDASLKEAFASAGPSLVDAVVDPAAYQSQLRSLRG